ncbi:hypothetical protein TSUD_325790 [Trifolium subterraneum]|uniref:Uncharacterized protein n=1 Tax=Trifolium subterraneum TaxID=3900 RepID=A0A2Z6MFH9_TRISU|nr:hypothetical protein TSUD_325790 [Trifolium subterraneum]
MNAANTPFVPHPTGPSVRPKRTKLEKYVSKNKGEVTKILNVLLIQNNLLMHIMLEQQVIRDWIATNVCPRYEIPLPPINPAPHIPEFPKPDNDFSSDGSSPIVSQ